MELTSGSSLDKFQRSREKSEAMFMLIFFLLGTLLGLSAALAFIS